MAMRPRTLDDPVAFLREAMRRDFGAFLRKAFPWVSGGAELDWNWHLDAMAHQLDRVARGECKRLLVNCPPRNLKSITISVAWVAWMLGRDPRLNFVCVSYSNELSSKLARDCRAVMASHWYRDIFPRTILRQSRSAVHDFETSAGGGRLATSVTGTITGRGGDIIIIDDPIKPDEALSDTTRNSVNDWFSSTLASRLDDKANGAIITVMQRLHQFDLAGMLLEAGGWDHSTFPAIATEDSAIPVGRGRVHLRTAGDVLHPSRESRQTLEALRASLGSTLFSAQYQQAPVPTSGNLARAEWLKAYSARPPDRTGQIVQSWDTASKDGLHNDWSVCITAHVDRQEVRVLDVFRARLEFVQLKQNCIRLARQFKSDVLLIEDAASGTALLQTLRAEMNPEVPMPIGRRPEADKVTRFAAICAMIEAGQLLLPAEATWLADFKLEVLGFPNARYDDQADALSQLMMWVNRQPRFTSIPCGGYIISADPSDNMDFDQEPQEDDVLY